MTLASMSLLLLSAVLSTAAAAQPNHPAPASAPVEANLSAENVGFGTQSFQLTAPPSGDHNSLQSPDDICYRIRAYIFKRDDDHAPELVRSTTCGPRKAHNKEIVWPKAKFVPAQ